MRLIECVICIVIILYYCVEIARSDVVDETLTGPLANVPQVEPMPPLCLERGVVDGVPQCIKWGNSDINSQCLVVLDAKVNEVDGLEKELLSCNSKYDKLTVKYLKYKRKCGKKCK